MPAEWAGSTQLDLSKKLSRKEEAERLERGWMRLSQLRLTLGGQIGREAARARPSASCSRAGMPPARAGAIKRLVAPLDPRHVRVVAVRGADPRREAPPLPLALLAGLPGWGGMAVLDRSWYGRVLVERVEGFADREAWLRAYDEINGFERSLADEGMILVKFWLHISGRGAAEALQAPREGPAQGMEADPRRLAQQREARRIRAGGRGHARRTDRPRSALAADRGRSKRYARVKVLETVIAEIEEGMRRNGPNPRRRQ